MKSVHDIDRGIFPFSAVSSLCLFVSLSPNLFGSNFRALCMGGHPTGSFFKDLLKLHALSSTASCSLTIRLDEQILNLLDEQNSAVVSDEWADFMFGSEGRR